ncbi:hypothetical protein Y032_0029g1864 [Ancylostoma ceylanicum]|uniref:Uncharacterized protein n=2 Tax=Ancylostoma ceylanicum TaxID=53326 RepID=A0A016UTF1_9BILA|nr:hypothetical protein Y032_0029g1864 [Ancylostoma ceylanicum]
MFGYSNMNERNRRLYQFRSLHATEYPNTPQESGHAKTPVVAPVQNKEQQTKQAQPEGEVPANYPKPSDIVFEANKKKKEKAHCNGDLFFEKSQDGSKTFGVGDITDKLRESRVRWYGYVLRTGLRFMKR